MANASIEVNKQSVFSLLKSGQDHPFLIPEYQRPYAWTEDEVKTLFEDIKEFASKVTQSDRTTYFLGSVITFTNENDEQEIIDGQQRITSIMLLLRAIYTKLEQYEQPSKEVVTLKSKIEPLLWKIIDKFTDEVDMNIPLIKSEVINNEGNKILFDILKNGYVEKKAKDNYSKNYSVFCDLLTDFAKEEPMSFYNFVLVLIDKAILLPVSTDTQDTALTIFETLNNRGKPLSDSDIFKAKIYNHLCDKDAKSLFILDWQKLESESEDVGLTISQLFNYYAFYLRAKAGDISTSTPGLRRYFAQNGFERLFEEDLLIRISDILNLWKVVNRGTVLDGQDWSSDTEIKQTLDILSSYPNEFWKYPVVSYYLTHKEEEDFKQNFHLFLRWLCSNLIVRYVVNPSINFVKGDICKLNVETIKCQKPIITFKDVDFADFKQKVISPNNKLVRMLLKLLAYEDQDDLLPVDWEIEHILPQKWEPTYLEGANKDMILENIEHLGNKVPFEKQLNIQASNNYFSVKKEDYKKSSIVMTQKLVNWTGTNWKVQEIISRDALLKEQFEMITKRWITDYNGSVNPDEQKPSKEDLERIEEFKKKGWI